MRRELYFDVLKGIAIFMVVMGHVITMCIRDIDQTPLFKFVGHIHMPLFFFISGWFSCRTDATGRLRMPSLGKRAAQLLVPMVVVSSLWIWYFPHSGLYSPLQSTFGGLWLDPMKNGYWFTLCLFEIILVFAALVPLLRSSKGLGADCALGALGWLVVVSLYVVFSGTEIDAFLGLELPATFFPAFMVGYIASRHRDGFYRLTQNGWFTASALIVGAVALYYICWWWEFPGIEFWEEVQLARKLAHLVFHVCLAIVAVAVFKPIVTRQCAADREPPQWIKIWTYVGVNSLGIYLLHYFFLFPMGCVKDAMLSLNLGFVPMLAVSSCCAAAIIAVVLGLMRVIAVSAPLNFLLTGTLPRKKK